MLRIQKILVKETSWVHVSKSVSSVLTCEGKCICICIYSFFYGFFFLPPVGLYASLHVCIA